MDKRMTKYEALLLRVQREIPGSRIMRASNSWLVRCIRWFLRTVFRIKTNYTNFSTTVGRTVYVSDAFLDAWEPIKRYRQLRHELVHLRQFRCWPFRFLGVKGLWRINAVIMGFCYIFLFPVRWTFRAKFEREAYLQTMLVNYELGCLNTTHAVKNFINELVETFSSEKYFYMWNAKDAREWAEFWYHKIRIGAFKNDIDRIDLAA